MTKFRRNAPADNAFLHAMSSWSSWLKRSAPAVTAGLCLLAMSPINAGFWKALDGSSLTIQETFAPQRNLTQAAFVYNTRNPEALFGNFYYTLGTQLAAQGQLMTAEPLLSKAVHLLPNNPYVRMNDGLVLEALKKHPEALARYQEAIKLSPKMAQAYYSQGLLQDKMGDTDKAIESLNKALELTPDNASMNYDLGVFYAKHDDYEKSALYSKKAAEGDSDFAEAYNNYGYALAKLGKYDEALLAVSRALLLKPESAAALDTKGFALAGLQRYTEALDVYKQAIKLDPSIGEIYKHMGDVQEKLNQCVPMQKSYQLYLELTPDAADKTQVEGKIKQCQPQMPAQASPAKRNPSAQTKPAEAKPVDDKPSQSSTDTPSAAGKK